MTKQPASPENGLAREAQREAVEAREERPLREAEDCLRQRTNVARLAMAAEDPEFAMDVLMPEFEQITAGFKSISYFRKKNKSWTAEVAVRPLRPRLSEEQTRDFGLLADASSTMADALVASSDDEESLWQARLLYEHVSSLHYAGFSELLADPTSPRPEALTSFKHAAEAAMKRIDTFRGGNLPAYEEELINRLATWADRIDREELMESRKLLHTIRTEIRMKRFEDHPIRLKREMLQDAGDQLKKLLPWGEPKTDVDRRAAYVLKEGLERLEGVPAKRAPKKRSSEKRISSANRKK